MSLEKIDSKGLNSTIPFASVGRYVDDNKWLSHFHEIFHDICTKFDLNFSPQETPAVIYATRADIATSISGYYPPLVQGQESTKGVIKELINLNLIDSLIALSGLTLTIDEFISHHKQNRARWDHSIKFFDIRASLADKPAPRGYTGTVINNEKTTIQHAFGIHTSNTDIFGIPVIKVRLGTIASANEDISEISDEIKMELYDKLPDKLTLAPLSKLK